MKPDLGDAGPTQTCYAISQSARGEMPGAALRQDVLAKGEVEEGWPGAGKPLSRYYAGEMKSCFVPSEEFSASQKLRADTS